MIPPLKKNRNSPSGCVLGPRQVHNFTKILYNFKKQGCRKKIELFIKKLMPIGISEFGKLINVKNQSGKSYNFVDKSMLINDIYSDAAEVMLITRPRRFGKTLNLSMIQHFFAKEVFVVGGERV